MVRTLREAPRMLALDRVDRGDFLRYFYRRYEGAAWTSCSEDSWELSSDLLLTKSFPAGIRRVREHRALGPPDAADHRRPGFRDRALPAALRRRDLRPPERHDGAAASPGELARGAPDRRSPGADHGRLRPATISTWQQSVAYADSASDLPMLEAAGHPVAVNPETKLAAIARKRGWHVEHWPRAAGYRRPLLPFGPR